ncbi:MAG: hypothetical protein ACTHOD_17515 [Motilibacteraceae bacterium]
MSPAPEVPLRGVVVPLAEDGSRSTSALGRAVVADALRGVDAVGARAAEQETSWRSGYLQHFRRLVEAGLVAPDAAVEIARSGLASVSSRMRVVGPQGTESGLPALFGTAVPEPFETAAVAGTAAPEREVSIPFHGERLRGDRLERRLEAWEAEGAIEPSCRQAVLSVMANPEWLDLRGERVVLLGAAAEMAPLQALLRWGADVAAVDLPRPDLWRRLLQLATDSAGTLLLPVRPGADDLVDRAGADLLAEAPRVAQWLLGLDGRLVLGNYVYADGVMNLRLSVAVDALTEHVRACRADVALAFLATPTDVFAVPADAVDASVARYTSRSGTAKVLGRPLRLVSGGRLLRRNYRPGADPGINDSLVPQQGPNYALAKRVQRWRATEARAAGATVSFAVAPPTRTRSVLKNRALAAAYAGAHRFGVQVFEPATSATLMAVLLVHALRAGTVPHDHPWQDEAFAAAHGGLWRGPYEPRSALGLAALLGVTAARS